MAARITKFFIFCIFYFITKCPPYVDGKKQLVPCAFVFGDSLFDNGNNNALSTSAKSNYSPYGIDYPAGPTGRFCNGKVVPDFLVEFMGFKKHIPPFATAKGAKILKGVNYASGGSGILEESGRELGGRISMKGQLINHGMTTLKISRLHKNASLGRDHLNKCLYLIYMGSNDYLNNYLLPQYFQSSSLYTPQQFADILINQYRRQLRTLYKYGARKVAIFGLGLIGYIPQFGSATHNIGSSFIDSTNKAVREFNHRLKPLVDDFNARLDGAQFVLINNTHIVQSDPSTIGIKVSDAACCTISEATGLCDAGKKPCSNRNEYYFWDNFHTTETANRAMATRAYDAESPNDAYPTDIRNLVRKK